MKSIWNVVKWFYTPSPTVNTKPKHEPKLTLHEVRHYKTGEVFKVRGEDDICYAIKPPQKLVEEVMDGGSLPLLPLNYVNYFRVIRGKSCLRANEAYGYLLYPWFYDQVKEMYKWENIVDA